jgi:hypothetical protein
LQITKTKEKKKPAMGGFELSQPLTEIEEKEEKHQKKAQLLLMTVDTKKKEDGGGGKKKTWRLKKKT